MKHDLAVINDVDVDMIFLPPPHHSEPCYCLTFYQHHDLTLISTHTRQTNHTSHQSSLSITSHCPSVVGRGNIDWRQSLTRPHLNINETGVMVSTE